MFGSQNMLGFQRKIEEREKGKNRNIKFFLMKMLRLCLVLKK